MNAAPTIVEICSALGDDMRWHILRQVGTEPASASSLATRLPISRQAVTQHLGVLLAVGLVERQRHGREVQYRAVGAALNDAAAQLETIAAGWDRRLDSLRQQAESPS